MSRLEVEEPQCHTPEHAALDLVIHGRERDIGAFSVRRVLPSSERRTVGPFIFFDELGPAVLNPGEGLDVRPHPHVNLATLTYLFEGSVEHRDSLGTDLVIHPGAVNLMVAGKGIVHSERSPADERNKERPLHGIQLWIAMPQNVEEMEPEFHHHPVDSLPTVERNGVGIRLIAGEAFGAVSPVETLSPFFYAEARLDRDAELELPGDYPERAVYIVSGAVELDGVIYSDGTMLVFEPGAASMRATRAAHLIVLGGEPLDGPRYIWWNFVSSSKARIEQAKKDWQAGAFPPVPGDEHERIALPEK